jgi:hypothetical protein
MPRTILLFGLAAAALLGGCATTEPPPLTRAEVVTLAQDGQTSPETLQLLVRNQGLDFPLSAGTVSSLRQEGLEEPEVQALLTGTVNRRTEERLENSSGPVIGLAVGLLRVAGSIISGVL